MARADGGLGRRLGRAFLLQAAAISVAAVVGVWAAAFTIEEVLIERALEQEAEYFWALRERRPDLAAPDTRNLTGYLAPRGEERDFPAPLRGLGPGFHRLPSLADLTVAYVTERGPDRLVLVFDGEQVRELSLYFGLAPLGLVLAVLYLAAWLAYRAARRAVSPVEWLAREVRRLDPAHPDPAAFSAGRLPGRPDREVVALADALAALAGRVEEFAERERNFTRDASHELRSPLTVIRIAADMLLSEQELERPARNSVLRIRRAAADMEELTEAFLLLARESAGALALEPVRVNEVLSEEVERCRLLAGDRPVRIELAEECRLVVDAPQKVLASLVGNLLRNAVLHTDEGEVRACVGPGWVEIRDSGAGMTRDEVDRAFEPFFRGDRPGRPGSGGAPAGRRRGGHGVGLTIVRRLSERFGWPVHIESAPGAGTRVRVDFPGARTEAR